MDLTTIPREFPQFGKSIWNVGRPSAQVFGRSASGLAVKPQCEAAQGGCGCGRQCEGTCGGQCGSGEQAGARGGCGEAEFSGRTPNPRSASLFVPDFDGSIMARFPSRDSDCGNRWGWDNGGDVRSRHPDSQQKAKAEFCRRVQITQMKGGLQDPKNDCANAPP